MSLSGAARLNILTYSCLVFKIDTVLGHSISLKKILIAFDNYKSIKPASRLEIKIKEIYSPFIEEYTCHIKHIIILHYNRY